MSIDLGLDIAQSLTAITILYRDLEDEAEHRYADKDIPGGDALVMLGPVANMEAYGYRQLSELMGRTNAKDGLDDPETDDAPPLLVMASWHDVIRVERGLAPSEKRATITTEADGIRMSIDWMMAEDEHGTPNFMPADELAKDLRRVRARLENILKAGEREDKGVPCMKCGQLLVKVWDPSDDESKDRWTCRRCDEWSNVEQYSKAVEADYLANADALTAEHMLIQYRIKAGSLTGWASKGLVTKRGKNQHGRILYDVAQAVTQRDIKATQGADDTHMAQGMAQTRRVP